MRQLRARVLGLLEGLVLPRGFLGARPRALAAVMKFLQSRVHSSQVHDVAGMLLSLCTMCSLVAL